MDPLFVTQARALVDDCSPEEADRFRLLAGREATSFRTWRNCLLRSVEMVESEHRSLAGLDRKDEHQLARLAFAEGNVRLRQALGDYDYNKRRYIEAKQSLVESAMFVAYFEKWGSGRSLEAVAESL